MDQITVNGQKYSGNILNRVWDKINNTVTVTRKINVTLDNYTETKIDDIVDTPVVNLSNDTIVTHVYDVNGKQIANRALSQGTGWKTDTKRVNNATGQVYYRVATGEYVKAEDVTLRGTSWLTDKTAKDAEGNTYYRVSTTEWVMAGNGVTFK
ncbi:SLAP domain-containing protein [Lactobacillus terrae]|uniref:SLAP domain-containing protein n=1 Tax=Lactobacillus terrae TaxID=2269374 RepID=UPI000C1B7150|nr:SLAP domain-containing protein [Lactobacillus terrae]